jgi:hypothetical protein
LSDARTPPEIFYSYSHRDEALRKQLVTHLSSLKRRGRISEWHDRLIEAVADWEQEISTHLESAQIILLLVSATFIESEYCFSVEMTRAMERHKAGEARVIPISLRDVVWTGLPFSGLQALPSGDTSGPSAVLGDLFDLRQRGPGAIPAARRSAGLLCGLLRADADPKRPRIRRSTRLPLGHESSPDRCGAHSDGQRGAPCPVDRSLGSCVTMASGSHPGIA